MNTIFTLDRSTDVTELLARRYDKLREKEEIQDQSRDLRRKEQDLANEDRELIARRYSKLRELEEIQGQFCDLQRKERDTAHDIRELTAAVAVESDVMGLVLQVSERYGLSEQNGQRKKRTRLIVADSARADGSIGFSYLIKDEFDNEYKRGEKRFVLEASLHRCHHRMELKTHAGGDLVFEMDGDLEAEVVGCGAKDMARSAGPRGPRIVAFTRA